MMLKVSLFFLLIFCVFSSQAQIEYFGIGGNVSYSRMKGFNRFVDAYNYKPYKSGGYTLKDSMNKMHLLPGLHFAVGIKLNNDDVLEVRYSKRKGVSKAGGDVIVPWERTIVFTMPTVGF